MRILIVEDEHKIANSIKRGLEQETYAVDVAFDGEAGYDLASTENYDVIILDLMLPGMNGLAICKSLRSNNIHIPILILTAKDSVEEKVEGLNAGADDYLPKPFSFSELLARVRALTRRPRKTLDTIYKVKDLSLDTRNLEVKRDGKNIDLSKTEYSLLEYLMRNMGTVVTKDQIIEHVWNYDADVLPNTVEVYIGYLRTKLEKPFKDKPKVIKTVRGFGYKIAD